MPITVCGRRYPYRIGLKNADYPLSAGSFMNAIDC